MKRASLVILALTLVFPSLSLAVGVGAIPGQTGSNLPSATPGASTQRLIEILNRLINGGAVLLIFLAVAFIVYAAYLYLTSAGDMEKVKTANRIILYSAVSVAVALLAYVFINIVASLVGPAPAAPKGPGTTTVEPGFTQTAPGSIKEFVKHRTSDSRFHYTETSELVPEPELVPEQ